VNPVGRGSEMNLGPWEALLISVILLISNILFIALPIIALVILVRLEKRVSKIETMLANIFKEHKES